MTQQRLSSFFQVGISDDDYHAQLQHISDDHKQSTERATATRIEQQAKKRIREVQEQQKRRPGRSRKTQKWMWMSA